MIDLCALEDVPDGGAARLEIEGRTLAVVRFGDEVYVIGDRCSHAEVSLSEGEVDRGARTIECWKHGAVFDLKTGEPQCLPATKPVPTYRASVVDGRVMIELTEEPKP